MNIKELVKRCNSTARSKGWHERGPWLADGTLDHDRVAAYVALIHSEASEALEELRGGAANLPMRFEPDKDGNPKPEGYVVEMADILIRIFDTCGELDLDLEAALKAKMDYNDTRPSRHGGKTL